MAAMCTLVMSYEDPLGATTTSSSRKTLVEMDDIDTVHMLGENQDDNEESKSTDLVPPEEKTTSVQMTRHDETPPATETNAEEHNANQLNANSWCIAVVTVVLCLLFFLYYCF